MSYPHTERPRFDYDAESRAYNLVLARHAQEYPEHEVEHHRFPKGSKRACCDECGTVLAYLPSYENTITGVHGVDV